MIESLHAKLYLIDNKLALLTSANLTNNSLFSNVEFGIIIDDFESIAEINSTINELLVSATPYSELGDISQAYSYYGDSNPESKRNKEESIVDRVRVFSTKIGKEVFIRGQEAKLVRELKRHARGQNKSHAIEKYSSQPIESWTMVVVLGYDETVQYSLNDLEMLIAAEGNLSDLF